MDNKTQNDPKPTEEPICIIRNSFTEIMKNAFSNISELLALTKSDFSNYQLSEKEKISVEKLILRNSATPIRVEEKSELKFYYHKYLMKPESGELLIVNREFKNIYKKNVD